MVEKTKEKTFQTWTKNDPDHRIPNVITKNKKQSFENPGSRKFLKILIWENPISPNGGKQSSFEKTTCNTEKDMDKRLVEHFSQ